MDDDPRVVDRGWDALPEYSEQSGDADEAVTVSISTTPGEWLVNTVDSVVVPMSMAEVVDALRQHKLDLRSLVWRAGMQEWAPVDRVPQLKLAARLGAPAATPQASLVSASVAPGSATTTPLGPPPAAVSRAPAVSIPATRPSRPPPKTTPPPRSSTPAPHALPSRRSTLPFGLPNPSGRPSSPLASARPAIPLPDREEPEVLAVYDRPAATISFDLAPVEPPRTASPHSAPAPQTLAPTTTDTVVRTAPRSADLSVVAASQFRHVQRSSKRLIVMSSVASAAAASLLTFMLSKHAQQAPDAARAPAAVQVLPAAPPAATAKPVLVAPEPPVVTAPPPSASPAREESAPKPKVRRAKAARIAPPPRPVVEEEPAPSPRSPSEEPNPYDVKLEDDPAPAKPSTHGSGLEGDGKSSDTPGSDGSTTPGF